MKRLGAGDSVNAVASVVQTKKRSIALLAAFVAVFLVCGVSSMPLGERVTLAEKEFPDVPILWSKTFQGKLSDVAMAAEAGHLGLSTIREDGQETVYYLDPSGKLLWKITEKEKKDWGVKKVIKIRVSDNGETIAIHWIVGYEQYRIHIYDKSGALLSNTKGSMEGSYRLSPDGRYLINKRGKMMTTHGEWIDSTFSEFRWRTQIGEGERFCFHSKLDGKDIVGAKKPGVFVLYNYRNDGALTWRVEIRGEAASLLRSPFGVLELNEGKHICILADDQLLQIRDSVRGALISADTLPRQLILRHSFFSDPYTGKVYLCGRPMSQVGKQRAPFYFTNTARIDKKGNIKEKSLLAGLIMGSAYSDRIWIYESDSEYYEPGVGRMSKSFTMSLLTRKK